MSLQVLEIKSVEEIEYVPDGKFYTAKLHNGQASRWRNHRGGSWSRDPSNDQPDRKLHGMKHEFETQYIGPLDSDIINGLIAKHNKCIQANAANDPIGGCMNRMQLISDIKQTKQVPKGRPNAIATIVEAAVEAGVTSAIQTLVDRGIISAPK